MKEAYLSKTNDYLDKIATIITIWRFLWTQPNTFG